MAVINGDAGNNNLIGTDVADMINGVAGNDIIDGGYGADVLNGGDGDDILSGGWDWDTFNGGAGIDTADYTFYAGGVNVNLATGRGMFDGYPDQYEALSSIENVRTGAGNDTIIGDAGANVLESGDGNDTLNGGAGNDILVGGNGERRPQRRRRRRYSARRLGLGHLQWRRRHRHGGLYFLRRRSDRRILPPAGPPSPGIPDQYEALSSIENVRMGAGDDIHRR